MADGPVADGFDGIDAHESARRALRDTVDTRLARTDPEYAAAVHQLDTLILPAVAEALAEGAHLGAEWVLQRVARQLLPSPKQVREQVREREAKSRMMSFGPIVGNATYTAPELDPWRKGNGRESHVNVWRPGDPPRMRPTDVDDREYAVWLPHSCDEWVVAACVDRDEAVRQVDRFIAELRRARDELAGG